MQKAKPLIVDIMQRLNPTSVLDLGCGDCRFSKRFIEKGISVVGVDKEPKTKSQNNFKFFNQDILEFNFEPKYDLIIGTGILHFLKKEDAKEIIKKMKENTTSSGFNFLICMSDEENPSNKNNFYPDTEVLNKLYSDWEIIHNTPTLSKKHGEDAHQHKIIIFLAKKN